jgi:hypothetical protein
VATRKRAVRGSDLKAQQAAAAPSPEDQAAEQRRQNGKLAESWLREIRRSYDQEKGWRHRAQLVGERFRDERDAASDRAKRFNIFYANTEILKPAVYSQTPTPDVRRRFMGKDRIGRLASMLLQRSLSYTMDEYDFDGAMNRIVEDVVIPGRGQGWVRFKPHYEQQPPQRIDIDPVTAGPEDIDAQVQDALEPSDEERYPDGTEFDEQGAYRMESQPDKLSYAEVTCEYIEWDCFIFDRTASQWSKVKWVAAGRYYSPSEVAKEFGEKIAAEIPYSVKRDGGDKNAGEAGNCTRLWEVWHKSTRKCFIFAEDYQDAPLQVVDDPLGLEEFFPCPEPLYAIRTNKSWTPIPEFCQYQDLADELDELTNRLYMLTTALKRRGIYDKMMADVINKVVNGGDNEFVPVEGFSRLKDSGGIEALISEFSIDSIAKIIFEGTKRVEFLKQQIYEVTGISDIVRGATNANETLGAQQLKSQYGNLRLKPRQKAVQQFVRSLLRIKAEIIAEHYPPEMIAMISGIPVIPDMQAMQMKQEGTFPHDAAMQSEFDQAVQMLRHDKLRGFRIDIETDSTVAIDDTQQKQQRMEFIGGVTSFLEKAAPAVQSGALPIDIAREILLFGVRGFKIGTELEDTLERLGGANNEANMRKQMAQAAQESAMLKEQVAKLGEENQALKTKQGLEMQKAQDKAAAEKFTAEQRAMIDESVAQFSMQLEERQSQHQMALDAHAQQFQQKLDAQSAMMEQMHKIGNAVNERTKAASARIAPPEMQAHLKGLSQLAPSLQAMQKQILDLAKLGTARRKIIYDEAGDPVGVEIEGMTVQ